MGRKKLTFKFVKQYFKDQGCELFETEYINVHTKMKYRCKCGNTKCKICFSKFKRGQRCIECSGNKKYTLKEVKKYFKEHDCELFETEYINARTPMRYRCSCGNSKCKITFSNLKKGQRCKKCGSKKAAKKQTLTFEFIYNYFEDNDCELLETRYINCQTPMKYKCICENSDCKITFSNFKQGQRCMECSGSKKLTFKDVKKYFEDHDCELFETEYINNSTKMKYKCDCGNDECKITFNNFKSGSRCMKCMRKRRKQTMLKKYGVPSLFNCGYSKESQKLFDIVYKKIDKKYKNKTYYATLNKEFGITYNNKSFKYDFVNSILMKAIEYNGSVFHPQSHQKDDEIRWCVFHPNKTVKEARDYEKIKYEGLEKRGYQILTVWDYELHKDIDTLVKKCLDFLLNKKAS